MQGFVDNENYINQVDDHAFAIEGTKDDQNEGFEDTVKPRELFSLWKVRSKTYKLKLTPSSITSLERVYKCNLLSLMGDMDNLPTLTTMLQITHAAMEKWHHNIKLKNVEELYNTWINEGGSMLQFYVEVYMKIFSVSGFFSNSMAEELTNTMDEAAQKM